MSKSPGNGGDRIVTRNQRPRAESRQELFRSKLKRFNVQDAVTGLTLFEHVWAWRGTRSTDGLDALVATFYQFASSIDKARVGVSRVLFELPQAKRKLRGRQTARMSQNRMRAGLTMAAAEIMEMVCAVNEKIRVVLFHDVTRGGEIEKIDDMVLDLMQNFTKIFGDSLAKGGAGDKELRSLLTDVYQSNPSDERNAKYGKIHERFKSFDDELISIVSRFAKMPSGTADGNKFLETGLSRVGSSTGNMLSKLIEEEKMAGRLNGGTNATSIELSVATPVKTGVEADAVDAAGQSASETIKDNSSTIAEKSSTL